MSPNILISSKIRTTKGWSSNSLRDPFGPQFDTHLQPASKRGLISVSSKGVRQYLQCMTCHRARRPTPLCNKGTWTVIFHAPKHLVRSRDYGTECGLMVCPGVIEIDFDVKIIAANSEGNASEVTCIFATDQTPLSYLQLFHDSFHSIASVCWVSISLKIYSVVQLPDPINRLGTELRDFLGIDTLYIPSKYEMLKCFLTDINP